MFRRSFPLALAAALLAGCARVPNIAPVAMDNPANASAAPGRPFPNSDFLNLNAAEAESARLTVTAGANLPNAPASVHGGTAAPATTDATHGMHMSGGGMKDMPGMKMNMSNQTEGK